MNNKTIFVFIMIFCVLTGYNVFLHKKIINIEEGKPIDSDNLSIQSQEGSVELNEKIDLLRAGITEKLTEIRETADFQKQIDELLSQLGEGERGKYEECVEFFSEKEGTKNPEEVENCLKIIDDTTQIIRPQIENERYHDLLREEEALSILGNLVS
jgi:hypothetical protein